MPMMFNHVEDITHHSKRTQAGNIEQAGTSYDKLVQSQGSETAIYPSEHSVPVNVTIESAVDYFRNNAKGEVASLYIFTADILEKYRVISRSAVSKALKEAKKEEEESVLEVSLNEGK